MIGYKAVIHLHSKYSFDSLTNPKRIIDKAVSGGIDLICITDHDTIAGSLAAKEYALEKYGDRIEVLVGAEYCSNFGDLIGIGIQEEIKQKEASALIRAVKEQGGLVLFPHPFYHHSEIEWLAEQSDLIEVFNARIPKDLNKKAEDLANSIKKQTYVSSDAHFLEDSFLCINHFEIFAETPSDYKETLLLSNRSFLTSYSRVSNVYKSQFVKGVKQKNIRLMIESGISYLSSAFKSQSS